MLATLLLSETGVLLCSQPYTNKQTKENKAGAGEMAQWVSAPDCSSEGHEFKSQQPHGGLLLGCGCGGKREWEKT